MGVKGNLKTARTLLRGGWHILAAYFRFIRKYAKHPERYPIEKRYSDLRHLIVQISEAMRFHLELEGFEKGVELPPCLYVANHCSTIDPVFLVLTSPRPVRFVAKKELKKAPFVGKVLIGLDCIFLDREDPRQALRVFAEASENLRQGKCSYCIYPEGTRNKNPLTTDPAPFHAGSLKIATRAKAPIALYTCFGSFRIFGTNDFHSSALVQMKLHPLLTAEQYADKNTNQLAEMLWQQTKEDVDAFKKKDAAYEASPAIRHLGEAWWKDENLPLDLERRA